MTKNNVKIFLSFSFVVVFSLQLFAQDVILNEIVAKNALSYVDANGDSPDWIEIKNVSSSAVDLTQYSLTFSGNPDVSYQFTKRTFYGENCYLVSSKKTGVSLEASKGTVYLLKNGKIIDSISWKNLPVDVSVGRINDDKSTLCYFEKPTPGVANDASSAYVAKTLEKPKLSVESCLFRSAFSVFVYSSDDKVEYRYTTDGSVPTKESALWTGELKISRATILRVRAFRTGYLPSETTTATYLIPHNLNLPIAAVSANNEDFFSDSRGIYAEGPYAEEEEPHYGANYWQDWERPVHLDFFAENGKCVVSQDLGCKIGGNWSRAQPQKTLKLYARDQYGKDEIEYQFFKDKPISSFHMILLRNSGNDCNNTQMRDGVISELAKEMNIDRQAYQPAVVYINGEYYGIQNVREKQNKHYVAENYGYDKEDIDVVKNGGWGESELVDGNLDDFRKMRNFMEKSNFASSENYQKACEYIDIQNFIDYTVLEMYIVNEDWPGNNIAYWHNRKLNTPWRYLLFDTDFGLGIWDLYGKVNKNMLQWCLVDVPGPDDYAITEWATVILRNLLKNNDFERDFLNATADRLNTTFSPENVTFVIDSVYGLISEEMYYHRKKWGDNWQEGWLAQMRQFGELRADIMRSQTEDFFSTNGSYVLSLNVSEQNSGRIHLNTINVKTFPWSGKYFKNNTIFLTAIPNPGYEFVCWEGSVNSSEKSIEITTNQPTDLTAVFRYVGNEPNVIVSEIYYHTYNNDETEWLEIYNRNSAEVDLSNWTITFDRYNQVLTIPNGTKLNSFLIFANDANAFYKTHQNLRSESVAVVGNINIDFPKDFSTVTLRDANDCVIDVASYSENSSHAQKADGYGFSCEILGTDIISDEKVWYATTQGGSPTYFCDFPESYDVKWPVITEINYASGKSLDAGDWIEIYNPNEDVDFSLKNWMVKDKDGNISVIYNPIELPAQSFVVFADNPEKFHSIYQNVECYQLDLSLNSYIDAIELYNPYEFCVDAVSYSMFDKTWTKSALESGRTLSCIAVESDNSDGQNWRASKSYGTPGKANDFVDAVESLQKFSVDVYPNPCSDFVFVKTDGKFSYKIVSEQGGILQQGTCEQSEEIKMEKLPKGSYLLLIQCGENTCVKLITRI